MSRPATEAFAGVPGGDTPPGPFAPIPPAVERVRNAARGWTPLLRAVARRSAFMLVALVIVSLFSFFVVQSAPGDYAEIYAARKSEGSAIITQAEVERIRHDLGLDRPWYEQYGSWVYNAVVRGDFGDSWQWNRPVTQVIGERLPLTLTIAGLSLMFMYTVSIPIGIYSAVRQYSITDFGFSFLGYIGLATPDFLLALILMFLAQQWWGQSAGGLFSPEYMHAAWSVDRVLDMLAHLWVPVVVLGTAGTAFLIRSLRAAVLDELGRMYVTVARAGGIPPTRLLMRYPVRVALNPIVSTLGWRLTFIISGTPIVGTVMNLPDAGQLFLQALLDQDMMVAGALIFIFCALTIVGTFLSDVLLVLLDPRLKLS